MSTQELALQALHDDLRQLRRALDDGDTDVAARVLDSHERDLQQFIALHGLAVGLKDLLREQQSVIVYMCQLRDAAGEQIRHERQSSRAASAYLQAGTLE